MKSISTLLRILDDVCERATWQCGSIEPEDAERIVQDIADFKKGCRVYLQRYNRIRALVLSTVAKDLG